MWQSLPVGLLGSVMGLPRLALGWRPAPVNFGALAWITTAIARLALLAFLFLTVAYAFTYLRHWSRVAEEFRYPVFGNSLGTFPIAVLLGRVDLRPVGLATSEILSRGWARTSSPIALLMGVTRVTGALLMTPSYRSGGPAHD